MIRTRIHNVFLGRIAFAAGGLAVAAVLQGCSEGPATPIEATPQDVSVVTLEPKARPVVRELPGRIAPTRIAEVRARVSGIVAARHFTQGSDVDAGDVLYRLDPKPYLVELDAAKAALAKAEAVLDQATLQARRMESLAASRAVSQAQAEAATADLRQAQADMAARKADVARADLNLDHTVIRAPIRGRIGRALVTEGALVGQGETTHVATIQQLDPIYVDFTQSVGELNQLRRDFESGALEHVSPNAAKARLVLDQGEVYEHPGKLLFSDATVDPTTGQVTLRAEFPNPKQELLPGMFVRVQIEQGIDPDAIAVPQQAVRRNDTGMPEVYVVRDDSRAAVQPVRLGRAVDDHWLLLDGIRPGERVIVDGFQKFAPGDRVNPTPWRQRTADAPQRAASNASDVTVR